MANRWLWVVFLALAGCSHPSVELSTFACVDGTIVPTGSASPRLNLLPAFQGSTHDVALAFANAREAPLGASTTAPRELGGGDTWVLGDGTVTVLSGARPQIVYNNDEGWPGSDEKAARDRLEGLLARMGLVDVQVSLDDARYDRWSWVQMTPIGEVRGGRTEATGGPVRLYLYFGYGTPEGTISQEEAVERAEAFDACRTERPSVGVRAGDAAFVDGRLVQYVEVLYTRGTPGGTLEGGGSYHGCPPELNSIQVDAYSGAILAWDDSHLCI